MAACHILFCTLLVSAVIVNGQISGMQLYQVYNEHEYVLWNAVSVTIAAVCTILLSDGPSECTKGPSRDLVLKVT